MIRSSSTSSRRAISSAVFTLSVSSTLKPARVRIPWRVVAVSEAQLQAADEVWISSATREVQPVTRIDGHPVGGGRPGPLWRRVYAELQDYKRELAGTPW